MSQSLIEIQAGYDESEEDLGTCSDGKPCGVIGFADDGYCDDCPSKPDHIAEVSNMVGAKHDSGKPRMDLIPPHAEKLMAEVLTFGAKKYSPENWRLVSDLRSRYIAAAMRHINAWRIGEEDDPETGLPHLAHAMCNLAFIVEVEYLEGYTQVGDAEESPHDPSY